ncbi:UDP-N-acetylmuramoyl-L-alanine--D-glutamate ligase [Caminibacter sp.]
MKQKSLFGYGITTKALAKEGNWHIFDDNFKEIKKDEYGNLLLPSSEFDPENSTLEITSPGIPPTHSLIKKAKNLISEFDYFYQKAPFQIWITGTNGKTTTTQMIHHIIGGEIGGNIGIPIANLNPKTPFWVIEASSFQLHYTKFAKPNIFVVLPIKEDHISWHGSFENYINAKLSPLKRMSQRDIVILPKKYENYKTAAYKITYIDENDLIRKFNFKDLHFKTPFLLDEVLAKTAGYILNFKESSLKNFKIDPHKMEEIVDKKGRIWIDDSKATNVDATINALKRFKDRKLHLILGGVDKGQNFEVLFEFMKKLNIAIYIIGEKRELFLNLAKKYNITYHEAKTLENAVKKIDKIHDNNSIAILSPACASFDQFKGYKHRGEEFQKCVMSL